VNMSKPASASRGTSMSLADGPKPSPDVAKMLTDLANVPAEEVEKASGVSKDVVTSLYKEHFAKMTTDKEPNADHQAYRGTRSAVYALITGGTTRSSDHSVLAWRLTDRCLADAGIEDPTPVVHQS